MMRFYLPFNNLSNRLSIVPDLIQLYFIIITKEKQLNLPVFKLMKKSMKMVEVVDLNSADRFKKKNGGGN